MDGVAISIIGRPRPLPGHDTPNAAHNTYTLKCEEPVKYGEVAPAFGQPGGAIQLQIWGPDETGTLKELPLREWKKRGIIEYVKHD